MSYREKEHDRDGWVEVEDELGARHTDQDDGSDFRAVETTGTASTISTMIHSTGLNYMNVDGARLFLQHESTWPERVRIDDAVHGLLLSHDSNTLFRFLNTKTHAKFDFKFNRAIGTGTMKIGIKRVQEGVTITSVVHIRHQDLRYRLTKEGQTVNQLLPPHVTTSESRSTRTLNNWFLYAWEVNVKVSITETGSWALQSHRESYIRPWDREKNVSEYAAGDEDWVSEVSDVARYFMFVAQARCYGSLQASGERFVKVR